MFFKSTFGLVLDFVGTIFSTIAALITGDTDRMSEIWNSFIEKMINWGDKLWAAIGKIFSGIWDIIGGYLTTLWNNIVTYFTDWWNFLFGHSFFPDMLTALGQFISDFIAKIGEWLLGIWTSITDKSAEISADWTIFWDGVKQKASDIWDAISTYVSTKIKEAKETIHNISEDIKLAWNTFWDDVSKKVSDIWDAIVIAIGTKVGAAKDAVIAFFEDPKTGIFAKFAGWISNAIKFGEDLINGVATGVGNVIDTVIASITGAVQSIINAIKKLLGITHSPSEILKTFGSELMKGLEIGITGNMDLPSRAMNGAMVQTLAPAASVPVTMGSTYNYYQPNIAMNSNINGGMDSALLETRIRKIMSRELRRR
jgi:phage-related protein